MQANGLTGEQITQVRGFADQRLRKEDAPEDPSNRRISVIIQYNRPTAEADKSILEKAAEKEAAAKGGHGEAKPAQSEHQGVPKKH